MEHTLRTVLAGGLAIAAGAVLAGVGPLDGRAGPGGRGARVSAGARSAPPTNAGSRASPGMRQARVQPSARSAGPVKAAPGGREARVQAPRVSAPKSAGPGMREARVARPSPVGPQGSASKAGPGMRQAKSQAPRQPVSVPPTSKAGPGLRELKSQTPRTPTTVTPNSKAGPGMRQERSAAAPKSPSTDLTGRAGPGMRQTLTQAGSPASGGFRPGPGSRDLRSSGGRGAGGQRGDGDWDGDWRDGDHRRRHHDGGDDDFSCWDDDFCGPWFSGWNDHHDDFNVWIGFGTGWCGPGWWGHGWYGWYGPSWGGPGWYGPSWYGSTWHSAYWYDPWWDRYDPYPTTVIVYSGSVLASEPVPPPLTWTDSGQEFVAEAPAFEGPSAAQAEIDEAWISLAAGDGDAMARFSRLVNAGAPGDGLAEVGYAVCAAREGQADRAEWAVKWALREEPDVLSRVPNVPGLSEAAAVALARYMDATRDRAGDPEREAVITLLLDLSRPPGASPPAPGRPSGTAPIIAGEYVSLSRGSGAGPSLR